MTHKSLTPITGSIVGLVAYFSIESLLFSTLVAFCSGVAAWLGRHAMQSLQKYIKSKKQNNET